MSRIRSEAPREIPAEFRLSDSHPHRKGLGESAQRGNKIFEFLELLEKAGSVRSNRESECY